MRVEDVGAHGMIELRAAVHILGERRAVLPIVEGDGSLLADLPLRADADDTGELAELARLVARTVCRKHRVVLVTDGAQVPCRHAEIRRKLLLYLQVERLVERRDIVLFEDDARRLNQITDKTT